MSFNPLWSVNPQVEMYGLWPTVILLALLCIAYLAGGFLQKD